MFFFKAALALPLVSLAFAAPAPKDATPAVADATAEYPAMPVMRDITKLLDNLQPKIDSFNGDVYAMNDLERDAQNALRALQVAIQMVNANPQMGLGDALAVGPVCAELISGAYKMTEGFSNRKAQFQSNPAIALQTYRILDDTYTGVDLMTKSFEEKLPNGVSWLVKTFLNRGLMNNIKATRDDFRPANLDRPAPQSQQPQYDNPAWQSGQTGQAQPDYANQPARPQYAPSQQSYSPQGYAPQQQQGQGQYRGNQGQQQNSQYRGQVQPQSYRPQQGQQSNYAPKYQQPGQAQAPAPQYQPQDE